jgi:hypothetical protein
LSKGGEGEINIQTQWGKREKENER